MQTRGKESDPYGGVWLHARVALGPLLTADYFTLLGALQHVVDNGLASSPAPEGNRSDRGYEIPRIVVCLFSGFLSQRR